MAAQSVPAQIIIVAFSIRIISICDWQCHLPFQFRFDVSLTSVGGEDYGASDNKIGTIDSVNGAVYSAIIQKDESGNVGHPFELTHLSISNYL